MPKRADLEAAIKRLEADLSALRRARDIIDGQDPPPALTKRAASAAPPATGKKRICAVCKKAGHDRRKCPDVQVDDEEASDPPSAPEPAAAAAPDRRTEIAAAAGRTKWKALDKAPASHCPKCGLRGEHDCVKGTGAARPGAE